MRKIYFVFTALMLLSIPFAANAAETRNNVTTVNSQRVQDGKGIVYDGKTTVDGKAIVRDGKAAVNDTTMNRLERQEDRQTTGEYMDDAGITAKVKAKFVGQKGLDSLDIKVVTVDGTVTLMGDVDNSSQIGLAESTAKEVDGVTKVDNKLMLKN